MNAATKRIASVVFKNQIFLIATHSIIGQIESPAKEFTYPKNNINLHDAPKYELENTHLLCH